MLATKVTAKVVEDNSGVTTEIPTILTDQGVIGSVTDFMLWLHGSSSISTSNKYIQSIMLLIEFMDANPLMYDEPETMFSVFVRRLYSGTVGEDGLDPSGLYWIPASTETVSQHISRLTKFTDWVAAEGLGKEINKFRAATKHEERIAYAAWFRKNRNDFLGHVKDRTVGTTVKRARKIKGRTPLAKTEDDAIAFPDNKFQDFFLNGIGRTKDPRVSLRDKLILLLLHGAGFRLCEALTLWITDVYESPENPDVAVVRIYEERDGIAPYEWKGRNGIRTRAAFLKEKYSRLPRRDVQGTQHLGWKAKVSDHKDGYLQAQFFPVEFARVFMTLWRTYSKFRALVPTNHPYAFINFDPRYLGRPYSSNAFNQNYCNGLSRISLLPDKSKGLDPHGHRHNYGRRLRDAGVDPLYIKKCLHHKSMQSQTVYTLPSMDAVKNHLEKASSKLKLKDETNTEEKLPDWQELTEYGFDDIDPEGLFTGSTPLLGEKVDV